jgi:hypothetical protein
MNLPIQTLWVQTLKSIKKEDIGAPLRKPIVLEDGTVIEDDGFFHPGDWFSIGANVAKLLAQRGDVKIPMPEQYSEAGPDRRDRIKKALREANENR